MNDIKGVVRSVVGFSKIPDEDGDRSIEVEYILKPIDLNLLRKIFHVDLSGDDQSVLDMIDSYGINNEQAKILQPYVINGVIDLDKYHFVLECSQDENYDWSNGVPEKK